MITSRAASFLFFVNAVEAVDIFQRALRISRETSESSLDCLAGVVVEYECGLQITIRSRSESLCGE